MTNRAKPLICALTDPHYTQGNVPRHRAGPKTAGNLEEGEAANLQEAISELSRVFAIREEQIAEMQAQAGDNIQKLHIPGQDN